MVKFVKDKEAIIIPADPDEEDMWAISNHSRGRVAHIVTKASWGLDLDEWQTHCGWHFAQRFVKVQLVRSLQRRRRFAASAVLPENSATKSMEVAMWRN